MLTHSIWKAQVRTWCGPCFKSVEKAAELERVKLQTEIQKEKSKLRQKKLEKRLKMAGKAGG